MDSILKYRALNDIADYMLNIKAGEIVSLEKKDFELYLNGEWFSSINYEYMNKNFKLISSMCLNCGKSIDLENTEHWQVKYVNENGFLRFDKCCSKKCCQEIVDKYSQIHKQRYEDTINQCFQKLK